MIKGKVIPNNLVVFLVVFYTSMGISKYIQVLWFNNHNALFNYSLSYASMAIFGSLSFIISSFINHWSIQKLLRVFLPLYAIGMSLRVFYESPIIAILSGGISGIGASVCLLAIRSWIYYLSDENKEHKEKIISFRYTIMQISLTIATLISGQLIFFINTNNKYIYLLVISAIMLLFLIGMKNIPIRNSVETKKNKKTFKLPTNKSHSIFLYLSVLILGIFT
ncbi:MFS transporter, partial [Brochothrix thermosphacta]|uniref:MFS transporter n=1 Tax=Brochothrix thermosphacta TaxID=2756 RepID=UPI0011468107